jgi:hypothetical protein
MATGTTGIRGASDNGAHTETEGPDIWSMGEPTPEEWEKLKIRKREGKRVRKTKTRHKTYQFPKWVLDGLCKQRSGRNHLAIVCRLEELWFEGDRIANNQNPVILTALSIGGRKMLPSEKRLALLDLEHWGWVSVERHRGCAPIVTLKWRPKTTPVKRR